MYLLLTVFAIKSIKFGSSDGVKESQSRSRSQRVEAVAVRMVLEDCDGLSQGGCRGRMRIKTTKQH